MRFCAKPFGFLPAGKGPKVASPLVGEGQGGGVFTDDGGASKLREQSDEARPVFTLPAAGGSVFLAGARRRHLTRLPVLTDDDWVFGVLIVRAEG
jgi:hypothetical protein